MLGNAWGGQHHTQILETDSFSTGHEEALGNPNGGNEMSHWTWPTQDRGGRGVSKVCLREMMRSSSPGSKVEREPRSDDKARSQLSHRCRELVTPFPFSPLCVCLGELRGTHRALRMDNQLHLGTQNTGAGRGRYWRRDDVSRSRRETTDKWKPMNAT